MTKGNARNNALLSDAASRRHLLPVAPSRLRQEETYVAKDSLAGMNMARSHRSPSPVTDKPGSLKGSCLERLAHMTMPTCDTKLIFETQSARVQLSR